MFRHAPVFPVACLAHALLAATPSGAQEFCVRCAEPAATYRCAIDAAAAPALGAADPRAHLLCITELAHQGNHASCAVERSGSAVCDGEVRIVSPATPPPLGQGSAARREAPARSDGALPQVSTATPATGAARPEAEGGPPKTVEEMVDKSEIGQKTGLQKAGQTIAKTANAAGEAVSGTAKAAGDAVADTAKSAGGAFGKAGNAVGSVAKKSWNCVSSLFKDC